MLLPHTSRLRQELLARNAAALERWPERQGAEFRAEMGLVAEGLAAIAAVLTPADPLECARTWRFAGNACFDRGAGRDRESLEKALQAYERAEQALEGLEDGVEQVKLGYVHGKALLMLSDGRDLTLATQAQARLRHALALARTYMPEGVEPLREELATADEVTALLGQVDRLDERIADLKGQLEAPSGVSSAGPAAADATRRSAEAQQMVDLFGVLQQQFAQAQPGMDVTRRTELQDLMNRIGQVVEDGTSPDLSLAQMMANRGRLAALQRELEPKARRPERTTTAPESPAARLLEALQALKMHVGGLGMAAGCPPRLRDVATDLFARLARLTTHVAEAGDNAGRLRRIEADSARALAREVRLLATRSHLLLTRPVWPDDAAEADANAVFFSGAVATQEALAEALRPMGLTLIAEVTPGADFATRRWLALRGANLAVFDLADGAPQVYYELGIALAIGSPFLLLAREDTSLPFDVAQQPSRYRGCLPSSSCLADQVDEALYALPVRAGAAGSLAATRAQAERLAGDNPLARVALDALRQAGNDPVAFHDALSGFNALLGPAAPTLLQTRWPGDYPDLLAPRSFAVMPFRPAREPMYAAIAAAARAAGVEPVRGDEAAGQEIIASIWQELCRASFVTVDLSGFNLNVCLELGLADALGRPTLLVGEPGTERQLAERLPGLAKRRCHTGTVDPSPTPAMQRVLEAFFTAP